MEGYSGGHILVKYETVAISGLKCTADWSGLDPKPFLMLEWFSPLTVRTNSVFTMFSAGFRRIRVKSALNLHFIVCYIFGATSTYSAPSNFAVWINFRKFKKLLELACLDNIFTTNG